MASLEQVNRVSLENLGMSCSLPMSIFSCIVGYYVLTVIYSLTLHPLAVVPGPKLCAISRIPYWIVHVRGRDVHWMHQLVG